MKEKKEKVKDEGEKVYKKRFQSCKMMLCEDQGTGELFVTYDAKCPTGYVEKIAGRVSTRGMHFRPATKKEQEDLDYMEKRYGKYKEEKEGEKEE